MVRKESEKGSSRVRSDFSMVGNRVRGSKFVDRTDGILAEKGN
jgi:hypothetical protein